MDESVTQSETKTDQEQWHSVKRPVDTTQIYYNFLSKVLPFSNSTTASGVAKQTSVALSRGALIISTIGWKKFTAAAALVRAGLHPNAS